MGVGLFLAHVCVIVMFWWWECYSSRASLCLQTETFSFSFWTFPLSLSFSLPGTACCLYTCINMRLFLLPPPFPSPICLSVCLPVRFCLPPPPPPLFVPPSLYFPPSFPLCSVSPLGFFLCFVFFSYCFFSIGFLILHVHVLSVCNTALTFGFFTPRTGPKWM